jgi:hypothetical protein
VPSHIVAPEGSHFVMVHAIAWMETMDDAMRAAVADGRQDAA